MVLVKTIMIVLMIIRCDTNNDHNYNNDNAMNSKIVKSEGRGKISRHILNRILCTKYMHKYTHKHTQKKNSETRKGQPTYLSLCISLSIRLSSFLSIYPFASIN